MDENSPADPENPRPRRGRLIALFAAAAVVVGAAAFAIAQQQGGAPQSSVTPAPSTPDGTETPAPTPTSDPTTDPEGDAGVRLGTTTVLDEEMGGQEAVDALGDRIDVVAQRNGMTADELTELLLTDPTARVTTKGFVYFSETRTPRG